MENVCRIVCRECSYTPQITINRFCSKDTKKKHPTLTYRHRCLSTSTKVCAFHVQTRGTCDQGLRTNLHGNCERVLREIGASVHFVFHSIHIFSIFFNKFSALIHHVIVSCRNPRSVLFHFLWRKHFSTLQMTDSESFSTLKLLVSVV